MRNAFICVHLRFDLPEQQQMRVGIDATPLTEASGGISRYTRELTAALRGEFPEDEYILLSDQVGERPRGWVRRRWWSVGLPLEIERQGVEVFHGTDFAVPYVPARPSVLTLHDLSPWREGEAKAGRVRRRAPLLVRLATMVITPTEAVRREAMEKFGLAGSRVVAAPLAAAEAFRPQGEGEARGKPFLLFVGTRNRRKNLRRLVEAWREARRVFPELSLVVVGRGEDLPPEPGLVVRGVLSDDEVAALMSAAAVFVYPSLYEGFGLPVLEAMQAGAPVIISRDAALREVAGDAAVTVDAESSAAMARAIVELVGNPLWRGELRERGLKRAAQFSWRQTARRTREVYVEALRRF
jgi:glycosyltransferase involved in cell wall biosynthesis